MLINKAEETAPLWGNFHGDGDRIGVIDENGNISGRYSILHYIIGTLKSNKNQTAIYDLRCSHIVPETITSLGETFEDRVGLSKTMKEESHFAGELQIISILKKQEDLNHHFGTLLYFKAIRDNKLSQAAKI